MINKLQKPELIHLINFLKSSLNTSLMCVVYCLSNLCKHKLCMVNGRYTGTTHWV